MPNKLVIDEAGEAAVVEMDADEVAALTAAAAGFSAIPKFVTMRQAQLALHNAGLLDQVEAAINASTTEDQIWWRCSQNVHRGNTLVARVTKALNLTEQQIDALFVAAAQLP